MSPTRNGAADSAADTMSSVVAMMQTPAANTFAVSQKFALETTRLWPRRMRAYADQVEILSRCSSPEQLVEAQQHFVERLQEDYATERAAFTALLTPPNVSDQHPNA